MAWQSSEVFWLGDIDFPVVGIDKHSQKLFL